MVSQLLRPREKSTNHPSLNSEQAQFQIIKLLFKSFATFSFKATGQVVEHIVTELILTKVNFYKKPVLGTTQSFVLRSTQGLIPLQTDSKGLGRKKWKSNFCDFTGRLPCTKHRLGSS